MPKTIKIAISLPEDLLAAVEHEIQASGENRSQFFRRAVEMLFKQRREQAIREQYIRGYRQIPETDEEVDAARLAANIILAEEVWE
jgi:metal-responsive CopG/Arc/MetJ family transcriptional regulator